MSFVSNPKSESAIGVTIEVIPKTAKMLKIFDPIKFPNEIAFSFFKTAMMEKKKIDPPTKQLTL